MPIQVVFLVLFSWFSFAGEDVDCASYLNLDIRSAAVDLNSLISSDLLERRQVRSLRQRFEDKCPKGKLGSDACKAVMADISKLKARLQKAATDEITLLIDHALQAPDSKQAAVHQYLDWLEKCEKKPLLRECRQVVRTLREILEIPTPAPATNPTTAKSDSIVLKEAAKALDEKVRSLSVLTEEQQNLIISEMAARRRRGMADARALEYYHGQWLDNFSHVDLSSVLEKLFVKGPLEIRFETSKILLVDHWHSVMVVLDVYWPYFTMRYGMASGDWFYYDRWKVQDGIFDRFDPGLSQYDDLDWIQHTHFRY